MTGGPYAITAAVAPVRTARLRVGHTAIAVLAVVVVAVLGCTLGPVPISPARMLGSLIELVPGLRAAETLTPTEAAIIWQLRLPRVAVGLLVGALLAGCGAAYQGVFRNPLADPYLLGAAAGAGLGAVVAILLDVPRLGGWAVPVFAFVGTLIGVALSYGLGTTGRARGTTSLILAGVAVSAFLSAIQTFILQGQTQQLQEVYAWLLGRLGAAGWRDVLVVVPYAVASLGAIVLSRRVLDVLAVGDDEARVLGLSPVRARLLLIIAASLGTAAAVSVSGLIGFVGLVVPHLVRLLVGASYRVIVPLSILGGAAVLTASDIVARTALAPAEIPIGVVTAFLGAPFFLLLLRRGEVT